MCRATPHLPLLRALFWRCLVLAFLLTGLGARGQGVELSSLQLARDDGALVLEFNARLKLSHALEDALRRGVPMYFVAEATLYRNRWFWRDERVARINRTWRLSYQPLTANWRLSLGGLSQSFASMGEAMAPLSRVTGWRVVELDRLDPAEHYYVDFSYQLDNSQLPQPMQIDIGSDWKLGVERVLRVEP